MNTYVDPSIGGAIVIIDGNCESHRHGQLQRWLLRREMPPCYKTLNTEGAPELSEAIYTQGINAD